MTILVFSFLFLIPAPKATLSSLSVPDNVPNYITIFDSASTKAMMARHPFATLSTSALYKGFYLNDLDVEQEVTIKKVEENTSHYYKILQTELDCLVQLKHDNPDEYPRNLIKLIGVINENDEGYNGIVLTHLPVWNLYDNIHKEIPNIIPWGTRVKVIRGVIEGIKATRRSGYVFQDLNTHCICIDQEGHGILADMSSLCVPGNPTDYQPLFHEYRDPEFDDLGGAQQHHEVYSLGIVFLEIILGKSAEDLAQENEKVGICDAKPDGSFEDSQKRNAKPNGRLGNSQEKNAEPDERLGHEMGNVWKRNQFYTLLKIARGCCLPKEDRISLEHAAQAIDALFE